MKKIMIKSIPFIDLKTQQKRLNNKIKNNIDKVLDHGQYIMGPEVNELENVLENYSNVNNVVSCASGTDALVLALMAYNIGPGDLVFCPAFTFPATAEAIAILGATPYFVDVDEDTFNLSVNSLNNAIELVIKENIYTMKAVISVDLYGLPADYNELINITKKNNMVLIADAAQSFGAEYYNKKVGGLADITCTSFFPAKPLGCYGDGGALFTDNDEIADKLKRLRVHGKGKSKYDIDYIGINSRLDTIQAAILLAKIEGFEWEFNQRNKIAKNYSDSLKGLIDIPFVPKNLKSIWAQYTVKHKNREMLQEKLKEKGIPTMVYYPIPMHLQLAYKEFNRGKIKNSEKLSKEVFSLPMYPDMSEEIQNYIIHHLVANL